MKHILGYARRAISDFDMIKNGDKVAVGLSGGKDSILTLLTLSELRRFYPEKFELIAITLDMGMEGFDVIPLKKLCEEKVNIPSLRIISDEVQVIGFFV